MSKISRLKLHQEIGAKFEKVVAEWLEIFGLKVSCTESFVAEFDLIVNGINVEVKAAYLTYRFVRDMPYERWQFNVSSKRDVEGPWFLILVAIDGNGTEFFYFIPGEEVTGPTIQLTSHPTKYSGRYAKYLNDQDYLTDYIRKYGADIDD